MNSLPAPLRRGAPWSARLLMLGYLLLAAWAVGLGVTAYQLGTWREELSHTLLQLNADAQFRARAHSREAVDPEWYRRKALALLSATERVQRNGTWTAFVPGSWRVFDDLQQQVQARIEREFSDIVVETLRRELYAHASRLTGVPLVRGSGELQPTGDCQSPVPQSLDRRLTGAAEDLPEFVAVRDYVASIGQLDDAVQSFFSLQYTGGRPEQLRKLVGYTLNKELPGALSGAVRMFQGTEEVSIQPALMQSRLQWAARCSLAKAMTALHTRLLNTNDLFALEQGFVERSAGLFEPSARPASFDRTLERYRAVHALLDDQNTLLSAGHNDWMRQATLQLGPGYQEMLTRIQHTRLLGPEVVQQLQNQSGAAFAEFRRQFEVAFGNHGEPGIVWLEKDKRFGLSSERAALLDGLGALLKTSFMADDAPRGLANAKVKVQDTGTLAKAVDDARALAEERARASREIVPIFPEHARPVVARVVDARVSELIYQRAYRALKAGLPMDTATPLDPVAFRHQREQVIALQGILKDSGGSALGDRLVATLDGEVLRRLAPLQEELEQQPLEGPHAMQFPWWQGEPLPIAQLLGAAVAPTAPASFAPLAARLNALAQQARTLLALGSPRLADDPAAQRWARLQAEVARYNAHAPDSSLARLEHYIGALGPDFSRLNCAERLSANLPPVTADDEFAQRHIQLHNGLSLRCNELRTQVGVPLPLGPQ